MGFFIPYLFVIFELLLAINQNQMKKRLQNLLEVDRLPPPLIFKLSKVQ